ncbi:major facilitator superfamily domain-containing protein 5 [Aaosphaeria arxii CBS 175.79]|uniref:Molybdate-anion transporter n=1 Tax=Aaosphaeria arxii CBS 175.79 TaxID=1450172 RepID=A0A6A5X7S6_9PLEO|nr:major facilitator superfamily domain-containing protein 5 [Aaosphaeria arxii CBS 175.79]KAF2008956.1 major facilitator superfamily domain-containing protein 5 [Aaosphaeria arxii CBS 175.79]
MDLYQATFGASLFLNSIFLYRNYRKTTSIPQEEQDDIKVEHRGRVDDGQLLKAFKWRFFPIYLLVNGADWLQGPYIYPIYKDEKKLPEDMVAALFMIGFLSGGVSASFIGGIADRCGRRLACLAYCIIYSLSCMTLLSNHVPVLFFGRMLGGMSGTLLYSVFESWMVAEFNARLPDEPSSTLSNIFSTMTMLNSVVAIVAGIIAECVFNWTGTAKAPFMVSILCLISAFAAISCFWGENYGGSRAGGAQEEHASLLEKQSADEPAPTQSAVWSVLKDKNILVLGLTSCFFEGSLFLFIFFKFPALLQAHKLSGSTTELPFGLIFAILMCSMMFGSMLYNHLTSISHSATTSPLPVTRLLIATLLVASLCFLLPTRIRCESVTLWCFCMFEVCCGIYYPLMGYLRGKLVDDGARASVYGFLRVPLNAFVVIALGMTKEGERHRDLVFTTCAGLLLVAAAVVHKAL